MAKKLFRLGYIVAGVVIVGSLYLLSEKMKSVNKKFEMR